MTAPAEPAGGLLDAILAVQSAEVKLKKKAANPAFRGSKYADLSEVLEKIGPLLTANQLVWTTKPSYDAQTGHPTLKYRMVHVPSKEEDEGEMLLFAKPDAQGQGSGITYARRYALVAYLNLVADDDDGNSASGAGQSSGYGQPKPQPAKPDPGHVVNVKALVRKHSIRAGELRKMLRGLGVEIPDGGNVATFVEALTPEQAAEFAAFVGRGAIPTGESDVPPPTDGDFKHPPVDPMDPPDPMFSDSDDERTTPMDVGPS